MRVKGALPLAGPRQSPAFLFIPYADGWGADHFIPGPVPAAERNEPESGLVPGPWM